MSSTQMQISQEWTKDERKFLINILQDKISRANEQIAKIQTTGSTTTLICDVGYWQQLIDFLEHSTAKKLETMRGNFNHELATAADSASTRTALTLQA